MPSEAADDELARLAARGDRTAFGALAQRHYDRVHALAWRWSGTRAAAEDIAQEAMVKMAGAISGFRGDCAFSTWLHRIAYTTAIDHLRAARRFAPLGPTHQARLEAEPDGETPEERQMNGELWGKVRALPEQQRDAVLLVYAEEMSHREAAEIMGCSEKTVSWHLHEARKRLRLALEAAQ
ncbi:RNA polymerase sigma factor [Methylocystis bryophila]|uniref:RNA polymerase subunit sigma-70 n=1 Tax=Methylocystis bryophila TaxID=655015 RepID=A0A1W6MQ69_9HYPH|nr:RNA polymerase sigma factor [Methylocystis bryophila]ARN79738.1 RNA polymerase subunit sigma-70 [Methylocystis bryophila]BDV39613.1 RNA polymerase sigma factor [Methylocystis bryophila]